MVEVGMEEKKEMRSRISCGWLSYIVGGIASSPLEVNRSIQDIHLISPQKA